MGRKVFLAFVLLAVCAGGFWTWKAVAKRRTSDNLPAAFSSIATISWDRRSAARYLDAREQWWQDWPTAHMDKGTICISCHTAVPYALVRPSLRADLGETGVAAQEKFLMDSVEKRVSHWPEMASFYSDAADGPGKTEQSRSTEAVLNAVILAGRDSRSGSLSPLARTAFNEAWALQEQTGEDAGGWKWQNFHLAPWESAESGYQGAAMLALAAGSARGGYAGEPGVREHMERLGDYVRRGYASQPLMSQIYVLWASSKVPGLLTPSQKNELIGKIEDAEERDGGWRLEELDRQPGLRRSLRERWKEIRGEAESDGVATGLVVLALEESGTNPSDRALARGVDWLEQNQQRDGRWKASSLNSDHQDDYGVSLFMSDAATGYAVLALENAPMGNYVASRKELELQSALENAR
jgi:hypothetical protein